MITRLLGIYDLQVNIDSKNVVEKVNTREEESVREIRLILSIKLKNLGSKNIEFINRENNRAPIT